MAEHQKHPGSFSKGSVKKLSSIGKKISWHQYFLDSHRCVLRSRPFGNGL
jgi:hypothetical protein